MTDVPASRVQDGKILVWDLPLRLFHWLLVLAVAVAFLSSEEDSALNHYHILSGWVAAVLIAFRIVWGFVGSEHARFTSFVRPADLAAHIRELLRGRPAPSLGHNALGAVSVILLLIVVAAAVWSGATVSEGAREELHEVIGWSLLALVAVHVVAVLLMSLLTHENLVGAMIHGRKPARLHPNTHDARRPGPFALLVAIVTVAGAVLAIQSYDPDAFTPRSTEAFEHRQGSAAARDSELADDEEVEHPD